MLQDLLKKYQYLENRVQKVLQEQPKLEAEREMLERDIEKKKKELQELGITFESGNELTTLYEKYQKSFEVSLDTLEKKLSEYDSIRQEVKNVISPNEEVLF